MATWRLHEANHAQPIEEAGKEDEQPAPKRPARQELTVDEYRALLTRLMTNLELIFSFPKMGDDFELNRDLDCGRDINLGEHLQVLD